MTYVTRHKQKKQGETDIEGIITLVKPSGLDQSQWLPKRPPYGQPVQLLDIICHAKANPGQHSSKTSSAMPKQARPAQLLDIIWHAKANPGQHSS